MPPYDDEQQQMIYQLIDDLTHEDSDRSLKAKTTLIEMGDEVVEILSSVLPTRSDRHQWIIIQILSRTGSLKAIPSVANCLYSNSQAVQSIAAQYLAATGDGCAASFLIDYLAANPDSNAAMWVVHGLGQMADPRAVEVLMDIVDHSKTPSLRYTAIEALGLIGNPVCLDQIRAYLNDENHHVRSRARIAVELLSQDAQNGV